MYIPDIRTWSISSQVPPCSLFWVSLIEGLHLALVGEKADRARKLQNKMTSNLTMAQDRLELLGKRMQWGHGDVLLIHELFWEMMSFVVFAHSPKRDVRCTLLWKPACASVWLLNDSTELDLIKVKCYFTSDHWQKKMVLKLRLTYVCLCTLMWEMSKHFRKKHFPFIESTIVSCTNALFLFFSQRITLSMCFCFGSCYFWLNKLLLLQYFYCTVDAIIKKVKCVTVLKMIINKYKL